MNKQAKIKKAEALHDSIAEKAAQARFAYHEAEGAYLFLLKHCEEPDISFRLVTIAQDKADAAHRKYIAYNIAEIRAYCLVSHLRLAR